MGCGHVLPPVGLVDEQGAGAAPEKTYVRLKIVVHMASGSEGTDQQLRSLAVERGATCLPPIFILGCLTHLGRWQRLQAVRALHMLLASFDSRRLRILGCQGIPLL